MVKQTRDTPPRPDWYDCSTKPCVCQNCRLTKIGVKGHPCLISEYTPNKPPKSFVPPTRRLDLPNAVQPRFDWPRNEREEVLHKEIARLHKEVEKGVEMGMLVGVLITLLVAYFIL